MGLMVRGLSGHVLVGYQVAVELGAWSFMADEGGGVVQATVRQVDGFWAGQPATRLRLALGPSRRWSWRLDRVDAAAGVYRVNGPPDEE